MGYTPNFTPPYEDGWEDLPFEVTPITGEILDNYDSAIVTIEDYLASDESQSNLADAYDETATYALGDYAIYEGDLYKCTTAITEAEEWDSTHWTACLITDEMGSGGGGGSTVTITPTLSTGTKIADYSIDGTSGELYSPTGAVHYSTNEQVIGTWVDGSTLYRKVINFGQLPANSQKTVDHNISNLGLVVNLYGVAVRPASEGITYSAIPLPMAHYQTIGNQEELAISGTYVSIRNANSNAGLYTSCYVTIEYTKSS